MCLRGLDTTTTTTSCKNQSSFQSICDYEDQMTINSPLTFSLPTPTTAAGCRTGPRVEHITTTAVGTTGAMATGGAGWANLLHYWHLPGYKHVKYDIVSMKHLG